MRMIFDANTTTTHNVAGVETRVPYFGDTTAVEYIDVTNLYGYFANLIEKLVAKGYKRGKSVRAAPYDWRKAPQETPQYLTQLRQLIEETYKINGNKRVILVAHSMGGASSLYFLQRMAQAWKDKYVESLVTLSGALAGAIKPLRLYSAGDNLGFFLIDAKDVRIVSSTESAIAFMCPDEHIFAADTVFAETPKRNYTLNDVQQYYQDSKNPNAYALYKMTHADYNPLQGPGVKSYCWYGSGVKTPIKFRWTDDMKFPDQDPISDSGDGDGTINIDSLKACSRWHESQSQPVLQRDFPGMHHMDMVKQDAVVNAVLQDIFQF